MHCVYVCVTVSVSVIILFYTSKRVQTCIDLYRDIQFDSNRIHFVLANDAHTIHFYSAFRSLHFDKQNRLEYSIYYAYCKCTEWGCLFESWPMWNTHSSPIHAHCTLHNNAHIHQAQIANPFNDCSLSFSKYDQRTGQPTDRPSNQFCSRIEWYWLFRLV